MPRSFSRFLSNRYNKKRENLNERYEGILPDISNICRNRKARSNFSHKTRPTKSELNINNRFTFHYGKQQPSSDWRKGDDIPIVMRREMELRLDEQLMAIQPISENHVFSHTIWTVQMPDESPIKPKVYKGAPYPREGIITALAKPRGRRGRKPKKILSAQASWEADVKAAMVVEPSPPVKKPIERRHVKQKGEQFTCSSCFRTFNHSWLLVAHMRVHTGERPFVCPDQGCQKSFSDRSNLRTHQRTMRHHNWEHQCGQCGKCFNQIFYLNRHTLDSCRKYLMASIHRRA